MSAEETIERIHDLGVVTVVAHPFATFPRQSVKKEIIKQKFDGIEVFNSGSIGRGNQIALKLAEKYNLTKTAGPDAHYFKDVGLVNTTRDRDVLEAIRKGKTSFYGRTMVSKD